MSGKIDTKIDVLTQLSRLDKLSEKLPTTDKGKPKEETPKPPSIYYINRLQKQQFDKLGIPLEQNLQDNDLTRFMSEVKDEDSIEKQTSVVVRCKDVDWLSSESKKDRKEFSVVFQNWYGIDEFNNPISPIHDIVLGLDNQLIPEQQYYDSKGNILPIHTNIQCRQIHTILWNADEIKQLVENSSRSDAETIQFLFLYAGRNYTVSYHDILNLSFEELERKYVSRGK